MGRVILATCGKQPGAVTTSVDVLVRSLKKSPGQPAEDYQVDVLACLMLPGSSLRGVTLPNPLHSLLDETRSTSEYEFLRSHLRARDASDQLTYYQREFGFVRPLRIVPYVANIPSDDLTSLEEAREFLRVCLFALRQQQKDQNGETNEVYVAVTGGRKAMSALAQLAAFMTGHGNHCYQAILSAKETEQYEVSELDALPPQKLQDVLHPAMPVHLPLGLPVPDDLGEPLKVLAQVLLEEPGKAADTIQTMRHGSSGERAAAEFAGLWLDTKDG